MEKIKLRRWMVPSPAVVVVAIAVVVVICQYAYYMRGVFWGEAEETLAQNTPRVASEIATKISFAHSAIRDLSYDVSRKMDGPVLLYPASVITPLLAKTPFSRVEYIRGDGINMVNGEDPFDASDNEYFQRGIEGESGIWINYAPNISEEALVNVYLPLFYHDSVVGVLNGVLGGRTDFSPMLEYKVFGEKSIAMLCDRHLNIIASNVSSDDYGKSFEQRFSTLFPPQFFSLLKQQAVRDEPGVVRLKSEKGLLIASISRVESTGWFVVQVAPHTVLSNISSKVVASAAMAVLLVVLLFLFYLRSVYRTNRRLQNENEGHHLNVINALTESYGSAFAVNLETGKVIVYRVNPNVARLMKDLIPRDVSYEQLILMYSKRVVHPEDRSLFERASTLEALNREFIRKDRFEFTYRVVADDKIHYLQAHFVKPSHERAEFVVGFKEIDEAMSAELEKRKELNEQRVALTKALEQAHRADRVKTEFLFNISHDFSVPLNAVLDNGRLAQKMVTEINLNKDENPVVSRYIGNILTAGTQLQEMINMVLDRARIESGKDELNEKPVLMAEIGDKLVATFEQMACQKNILFQVSRNFTVPCIYIDKMKYQQILLNIVSNAIKFTRERGLVRVLLENMPHESDGMCFVRLVVEDTGVGISESFLPKIFDDFEREQSALTRDTYGMGLGLSIVKQLVDLMHGTIEVSSRVGEGTRVVVKTPHRIADPQSV